MFDPFADFGGLGSGGFGRSGGGANPSVGALRLDLYETQARPARREALGEEPQRARAARGMQNAASSACRRGVVARSGG